MARYIDAEKLHYTRVFIPQKDGTISGGLHAAVLSSEIKDAPTADVEPVRHGEWIKENNQSYSPFDDSAEYVYICNRCGYKVATENTDKTFCSHCGARMDGEEK